MYVPTHVWMPMLVHTCLLMCVNASTQAFMYGQRTILGIIRKMLVFTCRFVWTGSMLIFWYIPRLDMTNKLPGIPFFPLPFPFPCRYMTDIFCFYLGSGNFNLCSHICAASVGTNWDISPTIVISLGQCFSDFGYVSGGWENFLREAGVPGLAEILK